MWVGVKENKKNNHWPLLYCWLLDNYSFILMDVSKQIQCNIIVDLHLNFFLNLQFWHVLIFSLIVTQTLCIYFEMWHRTEVVCSETLVLTRSPYLFMAIVNGLMPMTNLSLLSSMIRLFLSQMILLCMSSCAGREQITHHRDTHVMWISWSWTRLTFSS